jgi:hypothetical protein
LRGVINDDGQEKGVIIGHVEGSLDGQPPLTAEIALGTGFSLSGNERHEEIAFAYLPADLLIPRIPSVQTTLVVPDVKSKRRKGFLEILRRRPIFRGIAQKRRGGSRGRRLGGRHEEVKDPS